jgi:hypothetical protein
MLMKKTNEVANFRKSFKFYVIGFILTLLYVAYTGYFNYGFVTLELLIGAMFFVFLGIVVYLGAMILELQREIEEIRNNE